MLLSAASMVAASGSRAQATRRRRVAMAVPTAADVPNDGIKAFGQRMTELGWVEGRNIEYVVGYATRYEATVAELLGQKPGRWSKLTGGSVVLRNLTDQRHLDRG